MRLSSSLHALCLVTLTPLCHAQGFNALNHKLSTSLVTAASFTATAGFLKPSFKSAPLVTGLLNGTASANSLLDARSLEKKCGIVGLGLCVNTVMGAVLATNHRSPQTLLVSTAGFCAGFALRLSLKAFKYCLDRCLS